MPKHYEAAVREKYYIIEAFKGDIFTQIICYSYNTWIFGNILVNLLLLYTKILLYIQMSTRILCSKSIFGF